MEAYYRETNANVHRGVYDARRRGHRRASRPAATRWRAWSSAPRECVDLHQERQRGDQPGGLGVGRPRPGRRRRDPRHRDGAPLQHRPVADRGRDHRRRRSVRPGHPGGRARHGRPPRPALGAHPDGRPWSTPATCSARSTRSPRSPGSPTSRAPWCWWTARRASPTCRSTSGALDCDFLRLHRPQDARSRPGSACSWAAPALLESMEPFLGGGEMISNVTREGSTWTEIPWKFEAGTPADRRGRGPGRRGRLPGRDRARRRSAPTRSS